MFYEDANNIMVAEFGKGDILIVNGHMSNDETVGTISLVDGCKKGVPGERVPQKKWNRIRAKCPTDDKLNTVIRLVFTKAESVEALIKQLQALKIEMKRKANKRTT